MMLKEPFLDMLMVVCKKFFKILVVICLILITFLAFSFIFNRYKIKPTEKEIVELKKFYKSIIHISSIKDILVLQNFTIDKIKHESIGIDEIDIIKILKVKKGFCFDRSMLMQKALIYNGIDIRPVYLYSNPFKSSTTRFDLFANKIKSHNIFEFYYEGKWYVMETNKKMARYLPLNKFLDKLEFFKNEVRYVRYLNNRNGRFLSPSWIPDIY
jgi:hypothetical protein